MKKPIIMALILFVCSVAVRVDASWTFTDINSAAGSGAPDIANSGIAWHPSGSYAIICGYEGFYRFNFADKVLTYQAHNSKILRRIKWVSSGDYALITGGNHLYRYTHSSSGFGSLVEIPSSEIEGSGDYDLTFFDIVFNPVSPGDPPFISANRQSGSNKQIVLYRYDPDQSPMVYSDFSGGTTVSAGSGSSSYAPRSMAFQADGDYIVVCNQYGTNANGFHVFDPDQSTFPTLSGNIMQYYGDAFHIGNCNAVEMSQVPGSQFVLVRGNGRIVRYTQESLPAVFTQDLPTEWHTSATTCGEIDYSYNGALAIAVERQIWSPCHKVMLFDPVGDGITIEHPIESSGFTTEQVRITAVSWHPFAPFGIMGGQQRWLFSFSTDELPPVLTPIATTTPEAPSVPSSGKEGLYFLVIIIGMILVIRKF